SWSVVARAGADPVADGLEGGVGQLWTVERHARALAVVERAVELVDQERRLRLPRDDQDPAAVHGGGHVHEVPEGLARRQIEALRRVAAGVTPGHRARSIEDVGL